MILLPTFMVLRQPDLGTAILLLAAGGGMMFVAGVHWAYFAAVVAAGIGLITAVFQSRGHSLATAQGLPIPAYRHIH